MCGARVPSIDLAVMPIPKPVARFNKRFTNKALWPLVRHSGSFAQLVHRGRSSGRTYTTPVNVFDIDGGLVLALTYGRDVDWVKNVFSDGGCDVIRNDATSHCVNPRLVPIAEVRSAIPRSVRAILRVLNVADFVRMDVAPTVDGTGDEQSSSPTR